MVWQKCGSEVVTVISRITDDLQRFGATDFIGKVAEAATARKQSQKNSLFLREIHKNEHLTSTYRSYLSSTIRLNELYKCYRGRERSIEESARIVGLQFQRSNNPDKKN